MTLGGEFTGGESSWWRGDQICKRQLRKIVNRAAILLLHHSLTKRL